MLNIKLLDGSIRSFEGPVTGLEIAASISKSLEKSAIAIKINGVNSDLTTLVTQDSDIEIILPESQDGIDILRHDTAHVLAQAVKELYKDDVQITIGPTIENGFYYDFASKKPFIEADLEKIESKMRYIIKENFKIERKVMSRNDAVAFFKKLGEHYKAEIISDIPEDQEISIYSQGDFSDLCRGPHSLSTGRIKAFKLMKIAGAYWRGNSNNAMLQRIYGTAWATEQQLQDYLKLLEEAEKRDHRKIGKEMDLFHFQEEAPGVAFWHPKGWTVFQTLISYLRKKQKDAGYLEVSTPEILDRSLWEASGHWEKFSENMFTAHTQTDDKIYAVRPMNCPGGVQIFNHGLVSYRDLPLKLSEFGKVYRSEPSGALHGLMRVRAFTQDDAHIFCTPEQIQEECKKVCVLVLDIYKHFGFDEVRVKFADRPEQRVGSDEIWDKAEYALLDAIKSLNMNYTVNKGEGAFYGPKIEFTLRDAIGRDWQLGTLQVDLNLPMRLNAHYIAEDGKKHHPVMLHRALFGSLERFIGILLEHYAGRLPFWLSPIQAVVVNVTDDVADYSRSVYDSISSHGIRVVLDSKSNTISYKIREHSLAKIPFIVIIGKKELENSLITIRKLGEEVQQTLTLAEFISQCVGLNAV